MGFMDKLKSVGRAMSGGGAKVYLTVNEPRLTQPFTVKVTAHVTDANLKIDGVYLLVRAQEQVKISSKEVEQSIRQKIQDFAADGRLDDIVYRENTCELKVNLAGPATLQANQQYNWEGEVKLPAGAMPTFQGRNCSHVWQFQAGLDAFGNDPDSDWQDVQISA